MTTYGFSCVDCGRCCVHAPRLTIDEAFRFADTFLVYPVLYGAFFPKNDARAMKRIEADKKAGLIYTASITGGGEDGVLTTGICLQTNRDLKNNMCPILDERSGKCLLGHTERPLYCQTKPLTPYILPEHYAGYTPDQTYSYCVHEPPREGDDIFYKGESIVKSSSLAKHQKKAREAIAYDLHALRTLIQAIFQNAFPNSILSLPVLYQRCMDEGSYQFPIPVDLVFTPSTKHPLTQNKESLQHFYQGQIGLLQRIVEEKQGNHQEQKTMKNMLAHHERVYQQFFQKGRD